MNTRRWLILAAALALLVAISASVFPVPTTFSIEASTEVLQILVSAEHRADWVLRNARIFKGRTDRDADFTGTLRVAQGAAVTFERAGRGALRITIEQGEGTSKAADLKREGGGRSETLRERVVVVVPPQALVDADGFATTLPVSGTAVVGGEIAGYSDVARAMLLDGRIVLLAHSLFGQNKYEAGKTELVLGDWVSLPKQTVATGVLRIGSDPGMRAVLRVVTDQLRVDRYGAQGYSVSVSALERIKHDGSLQLTWAAVLFVAGWAARWWKKI